MEKKNNKVNLSAEEQKSLERFNKFRIMSDTQVPEEQFVFAVHGVGCMPLGDLSAVKAEPKMGKTTAIKRIVATALKGDLGQLQSVLKNPVILWLDTEQKAADAKQIIDDVKNMTGLSYKFLDKHLMVFSLRKIDCTGIFDELLIAIKVFLPNIIVVDGIAEFVNSVNDELESKKLIQKLMLLSEKYNCAIICVLHENRGGNHEMKGHLGANLTQKASVVIKCTKKGDNITVRCTDSRHQSTPEWSIRFDEQGNIVDADADPINMQINARPSSKPNKKQQANAQEKKERLEFCLNTIKEHNGSIPKKNMIQLLVEKKMISRSRASALVSEFIQKEKVIQEVNRNLTINSSEAAA